MATPEIKFSIECVDALRIRADVLILKYAQDLYGLDLDVYQRFSNSNQRLDLPMPDGYTYASSGHVIGVDSVLFLGVKPLFNFGYAEIRDFGYKAMAVLAEENDSTRHAVLTIHGPGYGLDELEAFDSLLAGVIDAIIQNRYPSKLEKITFSEIGRQRAERLQEGLHLFLPDGALKRPTLKPSWGLNKPAEHALRTVGYGSAAKPRVFVAMPFAEEMSDVFHYGIQGAVNSIGFLAERPDLAAFTGDIMDWVKKHISGSRLMVADLTLANPNVYLEVGYAWGVGVETILLARADTELKFDVQGQRCIRYTTIKDLELKLTKELAGLLEKP